MCKLLQEGTRTPENQILYPIDEMVFRYREIGHHLQINRFGYEPIDGSILLPTWEKPSMSLHWVSWSVNHEFLHKILHRFIGSTTSKQLDNIPYKDIACGGIEHG